jgi:hypothetical protein
VAIIAWPVIALLLVVAFSATALAVAVLLRLHETGGGVTLDDVAGDAGTDRTTS